jgi:hypothetical protein
MQKRFGLKPFGILLAASVLGAGSVVVAQGAAGPAPPSTMQAGDLQAASSATSLQSFLWVFDNGAHAVTFCFSVSSPETAPQYDFKCRTRTLADANVTP